MTPSGLCCAAQNSTQSARPTPSIAVLALGNLLRTDDGVGIHALRRLQQEGKLPHTVQAIEGGTLGLDLLPALEGVTHLLALDAVDTGADPGTLLRFDNADLDRLPVAKSVHLLGFADLLSSLALLDQAPAKVILLGIQPESTDWGLTLSTSVNRALNHLLDAAHAQISDWMREVGLNNANS